MAASSAQAITGNSVTDGSGGPEDCRRSHTGSNLDASADLDGDGIRDVVVGSLREPFQRGNNNGITGVAFCHSGKTGALLWKQSWAEPNTEYGRALCTIPDIDHDTTREVVVGARYRHNAGGALEIVSGKTGKPLWFASGGPLQEDLGYSVADAGDANNDSAPDLLVGAIAYPALPLASGAAHLISTVPLSLTAETHRVSLLTGGNQVLHLDAGPAQAGHVYLLLGSASGTQPGISLGNVHIPLNPDVYLLSSLASPHHFIYNNLGMLDASGRGQAAFTIGRGLSSSLGGLLLAHAFVTLGPRGLESASNSTLVRLSRF